MDEDSLALAAPRPVSRSSPLLLNFVNVSNGVSSTSVVSHRVNGFEMNVSFADTLYYIPLPRLEITANSKNNAQTWVAGRRTTRASTQVSYVVHISLPLFHPT